MESVIQPLVPGVQEDGTAYRKSPYDTRPFLARQLLKRRPKEVVLMTEELLWFAGIILLAMFLGPVLFFGCVSLVFITLKAVILKFGGADTWAVVSKALKVFLYLIMISLILFGLSLPWTLPYL